MHLPAFALMSWFSISLYTVSLFAFIFAWYLHIRIFISAQHLCDAVLCLMLVLLFWYNFPCFHASSGVCARVLVRGRVCVCACCASSAFSAVSFASACSLCVYILSNRSFISIFIYIVFFIIIIHHPSSINHHSSIIHHSSSSSSSPKSYHLSSIWHTLYNFPSENK